MQIVSNKWLENQNKTICSKGLVKVFYNQKLEDINILNTYYHNPLTSSNNRNIVNSNDYINHPTLEINSFILDESIDILNSEIEDVNQYTSNFFSKDNGTIDEKYTSAIEVVFNQSTYIEDMVLEFDTEKNEFARYFILVLNNSGNIRHINITDNSNSSCLISIKQQVTSFSLSILEWCLPNRRIKVGNIFIGKQIIIENNNIISLNHTKECSLINDMLPKDEISLCINDINLLTNYLKEQNEIKVKYGFELDEKIEWCNGGIFYLKEWKIDNKNRQIQLVARDILYFLSKEYVLGSYFNHFSNDDKLYHLARKVLNTANIDYYRIDDVLKQYDCVGKTLLPMYSCKNALECIAQASNTIINVDRKGLIEIKPINLIANNYLIGEKVQYELPYIELNKNIKSIKTNIYNSYLSNDITTLFKTTLQLNQNYTYCFLNKPATNLTFIPNNIIRDDDYSEWRCGVSIQNGGEYEVIINGNEIFTNTTTLLNEYGVNGGDIEIDNPLITTTEQANSISDYVAYILSLRENIELTLRIDPIIDTLDVIKIKHNNIISNAIITYVEINYNGAFSGKIKGKVVV